MVIGSFERLSTAARRPGFEAVVAALGALVGAFVLAWMARDSWFVFDHWDFLTKREIGSVGDLLDPHAGHWQTYTVVMHRLLYGVAGVDFSPWYLIPRAVFPAAAAYAAFLAMRWRGAPRWAAWPAFAILLLPGTGGWHTSATIGNSMVHGAALAAAVLVARTDRPSRRDRVLLGVALMVALSASGLGLAVYAGTLVMLLVTRRLGEWWPAVVVPAGGYTAWYSTFGSGASSALDLSWDTLGAAPRLAFDVLGSAVGRVLWASAWPGVVLVAGLAVAIGWAAYRGRIGRYEGVLLAAAAAYVPMVVLRRVATGQASAEAIRYAYVLMMLLVPALVPAVRVDRRAVRAALLAAAAVVLAGNVASLRADLDGWARIGGDSREVVATAAALLRAGEPALPAASPDPPRDGQLTVEGLRRLVDDGWDPQGSDAPAVVETARANLRILAQEGYRTVERGPVTADPLDPDGCAALDATEAVAMRVVRGAPISVIGEQGSVVVLEWRDPWGLGVMEVPVGEARWILWLADPGAGGATVTASASGEPLRVCGLRTG